MEEQAAEGNSGEVSAESWTMEEEQELLVWKLVDQNACCSCSFAATIVDSIDFEWCSYFARNIGHYPCCLEACCQGHPPRYIGFRRLALFLGGPASEISILLSSARKTGYCSSFWLGYQRYHTKLRVLNWTSSALFWYHQRASAPPEFIDQIFSH